MEELVDKVMVATLKGTKGKEPEEERPELCLDIKPWMVVQTASFKPDPRFPVDIQRKVVSEHERRVEIARMWKEGGKTSCLVPGSREMRDAKMRQKLWLKTEEKDMKRLAEHGKPKRVIDLSQAVFVSAEVVE